jgi:hypothetical protein
VVNGITVRLVILVYRMEFMEEGIGRPVEYAVLSRMLILVVLVYDWETTAEEFGIPVKYPVLNGMVILELLVKIGEVKIECLVG